MAMDGEKSALNGVGDYTTINYDSQITNPNHLKKSDYSQQRDGSSVNGLNSVRVEESEMTWDGENSALNGLGDYNTSDYDSQLMNPNDMKKSEDTQQRDGSPGNGLNSVSVGQEESDSLQNSAAVHNGSGGIAAKHSHMPEIGSKDPIPRDYPQKKTRRRMLLACSFVLVIFVTSTAAVVMLHSGVLILLLLSWHALYRIFSDYLVSYWLLFSAALLEVVLGIRITVKGDEIKRGERNIILMNHRTRLDWLYFWCVLARQSGIHTEKIVLKKELKNIPGAGWAMQIAAFIFLSRRWEEDKQLLSAMISYYARMKHRTQILLFPEGTDFCEQTKSRSDDFAQKNNLPKYNYVLHPRTTGFSHMLQEMRRLEHVDAIYDVTVSYPNNIPQDEKDLAYGNYPDEVMFKIKRYKVDALPASEMALSEWLKDVWQDKEEYLEEFYNKPVKERSGDNTPRSQEAVEEKKAAELSLRRRYYIVMVFWALFMVLSVYGMWTSAVVRWLVFAQVVFFLVMERIFGGLEMFQAKYCARINAPVLCED